MKKLLKVLGYILLSQIIILPLLKFTGNWYLLKGLRAAYFHGKNSASIDDAQFFKTHAIAAGETKWQWPVADDYNKAALSERLKDVLSKTNSVAFLIARNDSLISEHYWDGYSDSSQSNSFSMAKSVTTMLAQVAIQKGLFKDWHEKVNSILPDIKGPHAAELELWHLSTMSSGLDWNEQYSNPFCVTAKSYYGEDVSKLMMGLDIKDKPGTFFNYQSGSTELLGMCLMKVTGKSLAELASEWLWKPLGAQHDAKWHTDDKGTELAFCCFNTNARDFARFGKLMLHHGNWNGTQVIDSSFYPLATTGALAPYYSYSFWLYNCNGTKIFYQWGILGQYIIVIPDYNLVVVRLGEHSLPEVDNHTEDFAIIVEEVLKAVSKPQ